ncbi:DUF4215 domain-containing protein [Patescibacteria group bacterium]|nr:DUF4215 domain-containing protein [Patescibacteria group bacterium]MBU1124102.1 DUF4215 domain-containing protein [Patescibacteria group bacterium]MBU1911537.1 DUF4215 domain-containing protein [Patescibacteria group bacterium]
MKKLSLKRLSVYILAIVALIIAINSFDLTGAVIKQKRCRGDECKKGSANVRIVDIGSITITDDLKRIMLNLDRYPSVPVAGRCQIKDNDGNVLKTVGRSAIQTSTLSIDWGLKDFITGNGVKAYKASCYVCPQDAKDKDDCGSLYTHSFSYDSNRDLWQPNCGDKRLDENEECDDGGNENGDGCNEYCEIEQGDKDIDKDKDKGADSDSDSDTYLDTDSDSYTDIDKDPDSDFDSDDNTPSSICGDGIITSSVGENCDDKNTQIDDGCDSDCKKEIGWKCKGEPSVCEMLIPMGDVSTWLSTGDEDGIHDDLPLSSPISGGDSDSDSDLDTDTDLDTDDLPDDLPLPPPIKSAQCDECTSCGGGLFDQCEEDECLALGDCIFSDIFFGGFCDPNPSVCSDGGGATPISTGDDDDLPLEIQDIIQGLPTINTKGTQTPLSTDDDDDLPLEIQDIIQGLPTIDTTTSTPTTSTTTITTTSPTQTTTPTSNSCNFDSCDQCGGGTLDNCTESDCTGRGDCVFMDIFFGGLCGPDPDCTEDSGTGGGGGTGGGATGGGTSGGGSTGGGSTSGGDGGPDDFNFNDIFGPEDDYNQQPFNGVSPAVRSTSVSPSSAPSATRRSSAPSASPAGPVCGNGIKESGEGCDDGNARSGDGCNVACKNETAIVSCGDNIISVGEDCDDGNLKNGDGCSSKCKKEAVESSSALPQGEGGLFLPQDVAIPEGAVRPQQR